MLCVINKGWNPVVVKLSIFSRIMVDDIDDNYVLSAIPHTIPL